MEVKTVTVIDYGLGNLYSVERAIKYIGGTVLITDDPNKIVNSDRIILPGVGAFGEGMLNLQKRKLVESVKLVALSGRPFLGICLGMQLLMTFSEELGMHQGLNLIEGKVVRLPDTKYSDIHYKVPHIGWAKLEFSDNSLGNTILKGVHNGSYVYFAHSYVVVLSNKSDALAVTAYGKYRYCSVVGKKNIYGCQFHPEKSGEDGLQILRNFLEIERYN